MKNNQNKVFDIFGKRKIFFTIPIVLVVVTLIFNAIFGLEVAIEFRGGTMLTYSYTGELDLNKFQESVNAENLGTVNINTGTSMNSELETVNVEFASTGGLTAEVQSNLSTKLKESFKDNNVELLDSQDVNASSGGKFFLKCLVAVIFSFILLVIYIAIRFKKIGGWSAGVFSLVALLNDVFMVYATFVFLRFPLDSNFMAVVLTILGYSINDTIIIYDRIRENKALHGKNLTLPELLNLSTAQSLRRTINTSVTTGSAILVICIVCMICNVTSIMTFALPMVVGIVSGVYSSLFISGPLWVLWRVKHGDKDEKLQSSDSPEKNKIMV